jgi:hypothetical protein
MTARLRRLLTVWTVGDDGAGQTIQSASASEIFDFIDHQLDPGRVATDAEQRDRTRTVPAPERSSHY